jgi:hypothetical protein
MGRVLRCVVIASIAFASKASAQDDVDAAGRFTKETP